MAARLAKAKGTSVGTTNEPPSVTSKSLTQGEDENFCKATNDRIRNAKRGATSIQISPAPRPTHPVLT